ncbi:MAG: GFA family protein [Rhodobacteraceae bacterium]|nr:GFA family protein [Paracoccaceae bacterium]
MIKNNSTVRVSCHCGSIQLDVFLANGLEEIIRCNCSLCSRGKGFAMVCVPSEDLKIIEGNESITEYIFNTTTSPHNFCIVCGIHTHHQSRSRPDKICINVACIDGVNVKDYNNVIDFDGINHPRDL